MQDHQRVSWPIPVRFWKKSPRVYQFKTEADVQIRHCQHSSPRFVDPHYLSFSIDTSVLAGGNWWEGSTGVRRGLGVNRISPLDLRDENLDRLIKPFGPFYLRMGGSEADTIHYLDARRAKADSLILTEQQWGALHAFIQRNDLKLFFTAKYGLFKRRDHGAWSGDELERLLIHSKERGFAIDIAELGNELNAYWAFHGLSAQPGPKNLARDYQTFIALIKSYYPEVRISGPGSAFWPKLGEPIKPFSNITRAFLENLPGKLDIVDWHYYPFQSRRSPVRTRTARHDNMLDPRSFRDFEKFSRLLERWRHRYQPKAELWTGESGSAQCGGQEGLSDRWASCFWWADQLGLGAKLGQRVMVRQSLIGGEYGIIDRCNLQPRPDYWLSLLWKKLMGDKAHPITSSDPYLRAYCHEKENGQKTLMLINLANESKRVCCDSFGDVQSQYEVFAEQLDSRSVMINGLDAQHLLSDLDIAQIPYKPLSIRIKPQSINFWCLSDG